MVIDKSLGSAGYLNLMLPELVALAELEIPQPNRRGQCRGARTAHLVGRDVGISSGIFGNRFPADIRVGERRKVGGVGST